MGLILEKETFEKFGYKIEDLKPSSCKLVIWQCKECGIIVDKKYVSAKKNDLCLKCSNRKNAINGASKRSEKMKEWFKTHEHPLKGTKRPEHVLEALQNCDRSFAQSEEFRKKISIAVSGEKNGFYGKKHSKESIEKMSKFQSKIARRGKDCNFYGKIYHSKGEWYPISEDKKIWMRSSWEIKFAQYLDKNNIKWLYEPQHFNLVINDKECSYTPDFYLIDDNKYIEIKGWWRDDSKEKYDHFCLQYPNINIEVYMKEKLIKLGIL